MNTYGAIPSVEEVHTLCFVDTSDHLVLAQVLRIEVKSTSRPTEGDGIDMVVCGRILQTSPTVLIMCCLLFASITNIGNTLEELLLL